MNSVKSLDSEEKIYIVMDDYRTNLWKGIDFITKIKEAYGERVVFMTLEEFDEQPREVDFMILDELNSKMERQFTTNKEKNPLLLKGKQYHNYWQKGRWG